MSDDGGDLVFDEPDGPDDAGEGGEGGGGGGGNMCTACCLMLMGLALYPGALRFSAWNEQRAVCRQKALYAAEENSIPLSCSSSQAEDGQPVKRGDLGFLSCPLDVKTLTNFNVTSIPGLETMPTDLFNAPGLGLEVATEMVVCKEKCIRQVCERRRLSKQGRNDTGMEGDMDQSVPEANADMEDDTVESVPEADNMASTETDTEDVPARHLKGSRRRTKPSCRTRCVEWGYWLDWSASPGVTSFKDPVKAQQNCSSNVDGFGIAGNPVPNSLAPQFNIETKYAEPGQAHTEGGGWRLNQKQTQTVLIDKPVTMTMPSTESFVQSPIQPPTSWLGGNTLVIENCLHTCNIQQDTDKQPGCMRLSAKVSHPGRVALLGRISSQPGLMSEEAWTAPSDWLCSEQKVDDRVCPSYGMSSNINTLVESCGEISEKEEFFEVMHSENSQTTWIFRLVGFLLTWLGVCFICKPLTTCVQMSGDCLDSVTECIPGVGCLVDEMTDIFTGLVMQIVCAISCLCAFSSFVFVAAVMWVVMRPMVALPLLILGVCFCGGAGYLMHACRKQGSRRKGNNLASKDPLLSSGE